MRGVAVKEEEEKKEADKARGVALIEAAAGTLGNNSFKKKVCEKASEAEGGVNLETSFQL